MGQPGLIRLSFTYVLPPPVEGAEGGEALLEERRATLAEEERKLSQMKYMLGQLIMAADKDKLKPEVMNECLEMMNKCGQTVQHIQDNARK